MMLSIRNIQQINEARAAAHTLGIPFREAMDRVAAYYATAHPHDRDPAREPLPYLLTVEPVWPEDEPAALAA